MSMSASVSVPVSTPEIVSSVVVASDLAHPLVEFLVTRDPKFLKYSPASQTDLLAMEIEMRAIQKAQLASTSQMVEKVITASGVTMSLPVKTVLEAVYTLIQVTLIQVTHLQVRVLEALKAPAFTTSMVEMIQMVTTVPTASASVVSMTPMDKKVRKAKKASASVYSLAKLAP